MLKHLARALALALMTLCAPAIAAAQASGVPYTFQHQAGQVPASELDQDFWVVANPNTLAQAGSPQATDRIACQPAGGAPGTTVGCTPPQIVANGGSAAIVNALGYTATARLASVAALRADTSNADVINVQGYYGPGTCGGAAYARDPAQTAADNGGTVLANGAASKYDRITTSANACAWGATGSTSTSTSMGCAGATIALAGATDFVAHEPIAIQGCGAAASLTTPAAPTAVSEGASATFTGTISGTTLTAASVVGNIAVGDALTASGTSGLSISAQLTGPPGGAGTYTVSSSTTVSSEAMSVAGATSHTYQVVFFDALNGYTAASPVVTVANAAASLWHASGARQNQDVDVSWSLGGQTPYGVAVYKDGQCAFRQQTGVTDLYGNAVTYRRDYGQSECPSWLPATAPTSAGADMLRTTIQSVSGTILQVSPAATTNASGGLVTHDDTAALQAFFASQLGGALDCGTYYVYGPLTLSLSSQQGYASSAGYCATIQGSGGFDIETTTGSGAGYNNQAFGPITLEAKDMGGGWCLVANNANYPVYDVIMNHCYDELKMLNVQRGKLHVESLYGARGDFGFFVQAPTVATQVDTLEVTDLNLASRYQGVAVTFDGCVPNIAGRFRPQSAPAPVYMIGNKAGCTVNGSTALAGPQYLNLQGSATNGAWSPPLQAVAITGSATSSGMEQLTVSSTATFGNGGRLCPVGTGTALDGMCYAFDVVDGQHVNLRNTTGGITVSTGSVTNPLAAITDLAGTTHHFANPYIQVSSPNTTADGIYVGPGVRQVYIDGGQEFGAYVGVTFRGLFLQMNGTRAFGNTYASWECVDGNEFKATGGDYNYINGTPATSQIGGGVLDSSCLNPDVGGEWIGTQFNVHDQTPPTANTHLADRPAGSPNDFGLSSAGSQTIDLAKYPGLYGAADPAVQVIDIWNFSSSVTDTFDDSAATIIGSLRADQQRVGYTFDLRLVSHRTSTLAWAATGSGVSVVGTTTVPAPSQSGAVSSLKIKGTVMGTGASAAVTLYGCSPTAGAC